MYLKQLNALHEPEVCSYDVKYYAIGKTHSLLSTIDIINKV
jgi:hypothetical protein